MGTNKPFCSALLLFIVRYCSLLLFIVIDHLISFDTLWKHQKTRGFLVFSGGIKRDQWHETWNGWNMKSDYYNPIFSKLTEAVGLRRYVKNVFLEISQNPQKNTCARVSFLIKLQAWSLQLYLKKRLWHRCFPVNFAKFLTTPFLTEHFRWMIQNWEGCFFKVNIT